MQIGMFTGGWSGSLKRFEIGWTHACLVSFQLPFRFQTLTEKSNFSRPKVVQIFTSVHILCCTAKLCITFSHQAVEKTRLFITRTHAIIMQPYLYTLGTCDQVQVTSSHYVQYIMHNVHAIPLCTTRCAQ